MFDPLTLFIAAVFLLAGFTKGVIGLGLPTISMGLLALAMPTVEAAALLLVPSFLTNIWQMLAGPALRPLIARLWPTMLAVCAGTWTGAGLMTGTQSTLGTAILGLALILHAISGLAAMRFAVSPRSEIWLGPIIGFITGLITAATGVFVIPAVPYLQAIGLDKEELVQALGLSFTVSTVALAVNLMLAGALTIALAGPAIGALLMAGLGMWAGQSLRLRLRPATFRNYFFTGLLLLGAYLVFRSLAGS